MNISILIADDHSMVRQSTRDLLETQADFNIVGEASDGVETIHLCLRLQPAVLILDISMPKMNGLEAIFHVRRASPHTKIIIFSLHADQEYVQEALERGAAGYVLKHPKEIQFLIRAIQQSISGGCYISPQI
jgi:DNA-binding NarL/FixJ family response regulator